MSILESGEEPVNLDDSLLDTQLFAITMLDDQYKDIIHFLSTEYALEGFSTMLKKQLVVRVADLQLISGHLYKMGPNEILR